MVWRKRKILQTKDIRNPSLVKGASSIRLYKDSTVVFSSRKNYDLACGMVSLFFSLTRLCWSVLYNSPFLFSISFRSPPPGLPQVPLRQPDLRAGHPLLWLIHQGLHPQVGHGKTVQEHSPLLYIDHHQGGGCGQDRQPRRHRQPSSVQLGCEIHRRLVLHPFYSLTIATTVHTNHFPQQGPSGVRRDGLSRGDPEAGVDEAAHLLLSPALHPQVDDSDVVVVDDEDADLQRTAFSFPPPAGCLSPWPGPPCSSPPMWPASGPSTTSRSPTSSARKSTGQHIYHKELKNCNQSTLPPSFTMNNGIQTIVPKTSYLTFADYWLQACFGDTLFWIFDHKKIFQPSYL